MLSLSLVKQESKTYVFYPATKQMASCISTQIHDKENFPIFSHSV